MTTDRRWYRQEKNKVADALYAAVQEILAAERPRIQEQLEILHLYRQRRVDSSRIDHILGVGRTSRNVLRSVTATIHSRLIGMRPIPFYCSSGGDLDLRTRLEQLNQAVAGLFLSTGFEDAFASTWCLHGILLGTGFVKVNSTKEGVCLERVYPWEVLVDPLDALYGDPQMIYQIRWVDRPVLQGLYPERWHREAIKDASSERPDWAYWVTTLGDPVRVVEAWRLPSAGGEGRHVICTSNHCLLDEPYGGSDFPLIPFHYTDAEEGFWADGVGQRLYSRQIEIDRITAAIREVIRRCAWPRVMVPQGSEVTDAEIDNTIGAIIQYTGSTPPMTMTAQGLTAEPVNYLRDLIASCYEDEGVSQYAAMAQKPAGLQSGRSLRIYADQQDGRLRAPGDQWTRARTRLGAALVRAQRKVAEMSPESRVIYSNPKTRTTVSLLWKDVDLEDQEIQMTAQPVSSLPQTPAAKAALLEELYNSGSGVITLEEFRDGLDLPDITALTEGSKAPRRAIEKILDRITMEGVYTPPQPFFDLNLARRLGVERYCTAFLDNQPPEILELLQRWCLDCREQQLRMVQQEQPLPPPQVGEGVDPTMVMPEGGDMVIPPGSLPTNG